MKYFKETSSGEIYAYSEEQIEGGWLKEGLVEITQGEIDLHIQQPSLDQQKETKKSTLKRSAREAVLDAQLTGTPIEPIRMQLATLTAQVDSTNSVQELEKINWS